VPAEQGAGRPPNLPILERTVNGQPGLVAQQDGLTVAVFAFEVAGDRNMHIWAMEPRDAQLRPWTTG
jgi:RNA polymerase sigma-70 factor (ECF subfamily)